MLWRLIEKAARHTFLLFAMMSVLPAFAVDLQFRPVGENRGLDVAMPVDALVDRRGHLWIGGREGLYRYDGYQAVLFEPSPGDDHAITDLDIRSLYEDTDGIIWVATNTGGLNRLDPVTNRFTHFRHRQDDPATISHDSVYGMTEGPDGDLWVGSQIGLNRIDRAGQRVVRRYTSDPGDPSSLGNDYIFSVFRDRDDVIWVATIGGGLNRYNAATDNFSRFDLADATDGDSLKNDVFVLGEDSQQRLWIGTRAGLLRLDSNRVAPAVVDLELPGGLQPTITELLVDEADNVWAGTLDHGLIRVDGETGEAVVYSDYNKMEIGGLASQPVLSLARHRDVLFVGTWGGGLWSARIPGVDFRVYGTDNAELKNATVMAILAGSEMPLIGSFGGGVQQFDPLAGKASESDHVPDALEIVGVLAMARTDDDTLFVATAEGLYQADAEGNLLDSFEHVMDDASTIGEGYVTSLLVQDADTLWVGVGGSGLHRLDIARGVFERFVHDVDDPASISGNYITSILAEGSSYLWVGTRSSGLNRCRIPEMVCRHFDSGAEDALTLGHFHVTALHKDGQGRIWIGTDGGGLHEAQRDSTGEVVELRRWTEDDGLLSDSVMAIGEDSDGTLWLSTRHGLTRLDPDQGRAINYVEAGGLPVGHFNNNAAAHDEEFIYFGSVSGLVLVPRGRPFEAREPFPVRITGIEKIGNEVVRPDSGWVPASHRIRYGDMLAISFATLDYAEVPHEYEFRLDDNDAWSPLGRRNEVTLLKLEPGAYRFTARGRDIFGMWNESPPLELEVIPPVWMATWFRVLVIAALIALAFGAHRLRTGRLRKLALEIERLGARREEALEKALGGKSELAGLTPRQKEVLQLIAEGCSTRDIAERLDVSIKTIETHRAHLMDRLDIRDVPGLVRLAIRAGLVSPHD